MTADERVKKYFNTEWNVVDFFYAYCENKGIEDPETDLDDEEYTRLEEECEKKLTVQFLARLHDVVIESTNEYIKNAMR